MSDALRESLSQPNFADPLGWTGDKRTVLTEHDGCLEPLVYAAYFDLLSMDDPAGQQLPASHAPDLGAAEWLKRRFSAGSLLSERSRQVLREDGPPRITTLGADFYSPSEIARWIRWLDMEPENAMALAGLAPAELQEESTKIEQALQALAQSAPELHDELIVITRELLVLRPNGSQRLSFRGASSFALWGASAFNQLVHDHWTDYFKTLVHESAHTLLFALAREEPLVLNDPQERYGSPLRDDLRPMDGIFHAAFVSAREAYALDKYLDLLEQQNSERAKSLADKMEAELNASVCAFWDCCDEIADHGQLSSLGESILTDASTWVHSKFKAIDIS